MINVSGAYRRRGRAKSFFANGNVNMTISTAAHSWKGEALKNKDIGHTTQTKVGTDRQQGKSPILLKVDLKAIQFVLATTGQDQRRCAEQEKGQTDQKQELDEEKSFLNVGRSLRPAEFLAGREKV